MTGAIAGKIEIIRMLRSKAEHEDTLINHRIGWLLIFSGFLVTSYFNMAIHCVPYDKLSKIQLFGVVICLMCGGGVLAAAIEIQRCHHRIKSLLTPDDNGTELTALDISAFGGRLSMFIPLALILAWIFLFPEQALNVNKANAYKCSFEITKVIRK